MQMPVVSSCMQSGAVPARAAVYISPVLEEKLDEFDVAFCGGEGERIGRYTEFVFWWVDVCAVGEEESDEFRPPEERGCLEGRGGPAHGVQIPLGRVGVWGDTGGEEEGGGLEIALYAGGYEGRGADAPAGEAGMSR